MLRTMGLLAAASAMALAGCSGSDEAATDEAPESVEAPDLETIPDYVTSALADPGRGDARNADARRHTAEIVAFTGVAPGDKVLDLIPGYGHWSLVFSNIVGPAGRVYAVWPKNYADVAQGNVRQLREHGASEAYGNITTEVQPTAQLTAPEPLDLVFTSQNYHDYPNEFMGNIDPARLNEAVFAMLRPGGTYVIIDHAAEDGSGMRDTEALHRIDEATVRQQVEAAGFEFVGESRVLRNPDDDRTADVFDESIRGRTDQFVLRFRKPAG